MTINLQMPDIKELRPKITVFGVGGAGGNAVNNMIRSGLVGCEFVVANTDSQALSSSEAERVIQMGVAVTEGLGAGSQPEVGRAAAEEAIAEITDHLSGSHMVFVTAGMGGGTGTGAAPIVARAARDQGILTVGVVTKPFQFEGARRMRIADQGIIDLQACVDTLIVIPNQNLFRIANEKTTFADAFAMADQVLYSGVACITDLMVKEGLINLDFADVRSVMREMGKAMMGTGEASGDKRAIQAAEAAIANPLLDETSMKGANGLLISITGGKDLTLFEVDEAATRIREEVDPDANIILGATFEESLEGVIRVSVVATGIDSSGQAEVHPADMRMAELNHRLRTVAQPAAPKPAPEPVPTRPAAIATAAVAAAIAPAPEPEEAPAPEPATPEAPAARAEQPAPAAAHDRDITIAPYKPAASQYDEGDFDAESEPHLKAEEEEHHVSEAPFIPPEAEAPPVRMPRIQDFPPVAQRQLQARETGEAQTEEDRGPLSLLKRLAHVGLGRREDEAPAAAQRPQGQRPPAAANQPQGQPRQPQQARQPQQQPQRMQAPPPPQASDYAKRPPQPRVQGSDQQYRPRQAELDPHGRPMPQDHRSADDELEIPAFLRRQAN
ncbi:MAG: cell division protein FtsZ [Bauldia sp.]|uniref:cell division protein FtsZ n=1 Tax=Bauldia sp. TaxID=2575872 RepID=UPI001DEA7AE7|nr:cell division protein FtsZ [Bauldia sp.]MCB1495202.1 cell division protein FtsZ [Bauldia sp.]